MKNNSGISLITLIVMIIIILILAGIAVMSGIGSIRDASKTKVDVEMNALEEMVANRIIENAKNPSAYPLVGEKIDDVTAYLPYINGMSNYEMQSIVRRVNEDNMDYFRLVDYAAAKVLGVEPVDERHYFIVDYSTGDVYGTVDMEAYSANH